MKPIKFKDVPGRIDESIPTNEALWLNYIDRNPVHRCIQVSAERSLHDVNTFRAEYLSQGMNHFEGGWPKDINPAENDQTMRFRKKIEKDDAYINSVLGLCQVSTNVLFFFAKKAPRFVLHSNLASRSTQNFFISENWNVVRTLHHFRQPNNASNRTMPSTSTKTTLKMLMKPLNVKNPRLKLSMCFAILQRLTDDLSRQYLGVQTAGPKLLLPTAI